jgi:RsiW-degrading membrane proteinase PrsW (M82 family)
MADRGPASTEPVDGYDILKRPHYLIALGIGAISGLIAAFGETLYIGVAAATLLVSGSLFTLALTTAIAPLVEESTKPLGLLLLKEDERLRFDLPSWALLGSLAGVGFGFAENVVYFFGALPYGLGVAFSLLFMRGLLTAPLHAMTTTITGFGIGMWQKSQNARLLLVCLVTAMVIHGSFNLLASVV